MIRLQKPAAIAAEGHGPCKFYREGHRWVLGDTYREPRKMYLWDLYRSDVFTIGILDSADWPGPPHTLAPLNPHWSPDGVLPARVRIPNDMRGVMTHSAFPQVCRRANSQHKATPGCQWLGPIAMESSCTVAVAATFGPILVYAQISHHAVAQD